jgi:hypothetical protein
LLGQKANRFPLVTSRAALELRSLRSTIITRFVTTVDLSDSRRSPTPILADRRLLWPLPLHCAGSPVLTPLSFAHIPPPLPRSSRKMLFTLSSLPDFGLRRCSDDLDRYIGLFEACSAFNFHCGLHARWFAQRTFCIKGFNGLITLPHCLDCFRLERKLPGGLSSSHWI